MMASLVVWCLAWEAVGRADLLLLIPPFSGVLASMGDLLQSQKFLDATATTLLCFGIGMALAIAVGVPLGILMGRVKAADSLLGMWRSEGHTSELQSLMRNPYAVFG